MADISKQEKALILKASNEVSRCAMALVLEEPFYGHLLAGVNRVIDYQTPTAAVAIRNTRPILIVNPHFFLKRLTKKKERVAVLKHEVLHLLFQHLFRMGQPRIDPFLFNLAADIVVNQFIGKKWCLPDGAITLDYFPIDFELEPDKTVEWYYKKLLAEADKIDKELMPSHSDHEGWYTNDSESNHNTEKSIARHNFSRLVRDAKQRGEKDFAQLPEPIKQIVSALIEQLEPTIDWRRVLRMFSNASRKTRVANTLRRPSKRYGTYPGIKIKRHHRLAVIIDTSGSISDDELSLFFAEVHAIWRQGTEITLIEADDSVQRTSEYNGNGPPDNIAGRSGTAFNPALQWVQDATPTYDAAIYLTDGYAMPPTVNPNCKLLWVLTPDSSDEALTFGQVTKIKI